MYIMWKVSSSNKMAANYFVPPVNSCVCSSKLKNITEIKISKSAIQKTKLRTQYNPTYLFCLPPYYSIFSVLLDMQHRKKQQG